MTHVKCVVYFESKYNGSILVQDVIVVKDSHTSLKCLQYSDTDASHEEACSECSCYHDNADVSSTVFETVQTTNVPYMYCQTGGHLNNSHQRCNNSKRTLQLITGLDICYCNMNVCSATINKLPMDASLAGCVSSAICQSPQFCRGFLKYAKYHGTKMSQNSYTATPDRATTTVPFLLKVRLVHKMADWIDFKW